MFHLCSKFLPHNSKKEKRRLFQKSVDNFNGYDIIEAQENKCSFYYFQTEYYANAPSKILKALNLNCRALGTANIYNSVGVYSN